LEREGERLGRRWRLAQFEVDTVIELLACEEQPLGIELNGDAQTPRPLAVSNKLRCLARVSSASSTVLLEGSATRREHELAPLAQPLDAQSQEHVLAQLCEQTLYWRWQLATDQP
jgi:hypothetical protein